MSESAIGSAQDSPSVPPLAINLRKWRERRGMSLSALARQAGVSKSTISELERGKGNPSLDTLWSLAKTLTIPIGELFAESPTEDEVYVRRLADAPVISRVEESFITRLLAGWTGRGEVELLVTTLASGGKLDLSATSSGAVERVICVDGTVEVTIGDRSHVITPVDLLTVPADQPRTYRGIDGAAQLVILLQHSSPK